MAPLRRLCLCLCLPLLLPPSAAPAPAPTPRTDWAACGSLSRELSRLVATLKEPYRVLEETHLSEEDPKNWPPRIRCSDACDPATLDTNNTRCLGRILQGLQHYRDLLGSDIFTDRPLPQLETTLARLLGLVQQEHGRPPPALPGPQQGLGPPAAAAPGAPAAPVLRRHHEPRLHPQRQPPLRPPRRPPHYLFPSPRGAIYERRSLFISGIYGFLIKV